MSTAPEPRVAPLPAPEWGEEERAALRAWIGDAADRFFAGDDAPRIPNVLGTLMRHPRLAAPWLRYNNVLLGTPTIEPRQRELMILRVAWRTRSEYEWVQHVRLARGLGITDAEIDAVAGTAPARWSEPEAALLAATDELLDRTRVSDATWARLAASFETRQLVEAVFVVGTYVCLAMAFNSLGIALDPELVDYPAPAIPED